MTNVKNLVSLSEYAKIHGIPTDTVKSARRQDRFKSAIKIGRNWCVDKDETLSDKRIKTGKYINWRKGDKKMIRARIYGNSDAMGKIKDFKVVEKLPEDAVEIKLDPEQGTGEDKEQLYYTFYHSETDGYICIQTAEKDGDIEADTVQIIKDIKKTENPLVLAKEINKIYNDYKERMEKSGYDEYIVDLTWESIKYECDMM